jgi:hypothetical protein
LLYDIKIDFAGASGSTNIPDVGSFNFTVLNVGSVTLTTSNPRLLPTSGNFNGFDNLRVVNTGYSIGTDAFRIEVWFYVPYYPGPTFGRLLTLPGDITIQTSQSGGLLTLTSVAGGFSEATPCPYGEWHRLILIRQSEGADMRITGILDANIWFSRIDNSNYTSTTTWVGSTEDPITTIKFFGQVALFHLQTDTTGDNPAGRVEPPTISTTLSEGTTQQVLNNHFTGEDPRLVRVPYSSTDSVIGEWDLVSGFSAGFQIPRVRVRCDNSAGLQHTRNDDIGDPSFYTNASPRIWLDWEGGLQSQEWLNYDPHYFLFYRSTKKKRKWNDPSRPEKKARGVFTTYVHPANYVNGVNVSMVTNMGVGEANFSSYADNGNRASEWRVPSKRFTKIDISDSDDVSNPFNAWQYYKNLNQTLFPISYDGWYAPNYQSIGTKRVGGDRSLLKKCLSLRFCIAVRDPLQPNRLVFGPMSERVMIYPILGYFLSNGTPNQPFYYRWGAVIKS